MNIYSSYVTYTKITSPVTGYSAGRITSANIAKFGFASIMELHERYPEFPTMSQSFTDKQRAKSERLSSTKHNEYYVSPHTCKECTEVLSYEMRKNKFCSHSCANSFTNRLRTRSDESKRKTSISLKKFNEENPGHRDDRVYKKRGRKKTVQCKVCGAVHFKIHRKTCNDECRSILAQQNALKQEKHGGGKKGKYRGYHCDSSYELAFLVYHLDHDIPIKRCDEFLSYTINGVTKKYLPDFVVYGVIYEIKGFMSETAKKKLEDNPHVVLIDKNKIIPYINYVKNRYNINDVTLLYEQRKCKRCKTEVVSHTEVYCSQECKKRRPLTKEHKDKISNALRKKQP